MTDIVGLIWVKNFFTDFQFQVYLSIIYLLFQDCQQNRKKTEIERSFSRGLFCGVEEQSVDFLRKNEISDAIL